MILEWFFLLLSLLILVAGNFLGYSHVESNSQGGFVRPQKILLVG